MCKRQVGKKYTCEKVNTKMIYLHEPGVYYSFLGHMHVSGSSVASTSTTPISS